MSTTYSAETFIGLKIEFMRQNENCVVPRFDPKTGAKREVPTTVQAITAVIDVESTKPVGKFGEEKVVDHYYIPLTPDTEIYEDGQHYSLDSWLWESGDRRIWNWLQSNKIIDPEAEGEPEFEHCLPTHDRIKELVVGVCISNIQRDHKRETFIDRIDLDSYDVYSDNVKEWFKKIFPHVTVAPSLYVTCNAS